MPETIIVTGAHGLIGSAVCRLFAKTYTVSTIGRRAPANMIADIADPATIERLDLTGAKCLIHCAGIVDEDFSNPARAFRQAIEGMAALVRRAKQDGVRRFVYISSAHVYGPFAGEIDENSRPNPLHDYAIAHFASEQILRRATTDEFIGCAIRPCAVFGIPADLDRFRRWALIPFGFPRAAVHDGVIGLASRGLQRRNFIGSDDIARAISLWLEQEQVARFTGINAVGQTSMTVLDFANMCAASAERITGRATRVTRPDGVDPAPDNFDYRTIDPRFVGHSSLPDFVDRMCALMHTPDRQFQ
ncbi:NAD-dependent epimerase/dehydratase family protein [Occallatibacter riparius]|uniref:NAD-dependent epimerase/dehydratase family protein n=1 Tax=Occallatibacter riparius TaxID=1002689 RepID=A0A9J7BWF2_9BACT|nr:NAD-dependent epimerase/dehydratase family protein [Occallatibacter riparius]UWZ86138.1 NAD-dependent epimerase/dehydratase family protein [Occallatibacter riparius]